jgi:hypothetical protein
MDNENNAPIIPAGTEPTVFGTTAFSGQAQNSPDMGQSEANIPQTSTNQAPSRTSFEELAAKKGFQSADDLADAYRNLESQNTRVEMSLAELAKIRSTQSEQPSEVPTQVETQDDAMKVVENIVRRYTRPLEDKLQLSDLFNKNPDAQSYAGEMGRLVKENPGISWDVAYKAAKFDALDKQSRERGRQEAYQAIQQKQAVAPQPVKAALNKEASLSDIVRDKSVPFKEIQRIMKERFSQ